MKVSCTCNFTQAYSVIQQRKLIKNHTVSPSEPKQVSFGSFESAKKGALMGGVLCALMFASAGAELSLIAIKAFETSILGAVVGSLFKREKGEDSLKD